MNGQIREERQEKTGELLEGSQGASDSRMSQMLPDSKDVNQLVGDRLHGMSNGVTSLASLFRESMVKFYLSLKSQSQVPLVVVITLVMILLLMQDLIFPPIRDLARKDAARAHILESTTERSRVLQKAAKMIDIF